MRSARCFANASRERQLPGDVRGTLAALQLKHVCAVAAAADAMMAVRRQPHLLAVHQQPITSTHRANIANTRHTFNSNRDDLCWYHAKFEKQATNCRYPCSFSKNEHTSHQRPAAAGVTGQTSRVLYVWYRYAGHRFLVDSGEEVSVSPAISCDRRCQKRGDSLIAANGTPITTYDTKTIPLNLGFGAIQVLRNADGGGGVSDFLEKSVTKA